VLAFSDPAVIRLVSERYVPVAGNGIRLFWRKDAEGDFFREVVSSVPQPYKEDPSRQGIYCASPSGRLLAHIRNMSGHMDVPGVLQQGLREFERLSASERAPGAVGELTADPYAVTLPPAGGVVLRTYTRRMQRSAGELAASSVAFFRHDMVFGSEPQYDHVWITRAEAAALIPSPLKVGASCDLPDSLAAQICRYHLADTTWRGSEEWSPSEIRARRFTCTVEAVDAGGATIAVVGHALFARGPRMRMDAVVKGTLHYDTGRRTIDSFDMVAIGKRSERGDRGQALTSYLGIAFERADGSDAGDAIPPHDKDWWFRDREGGEPR